MTFTITNLAGGRALVQGEDSFGNTGKTLVDGYEWAQLKLERTHEELHEEFDAKVAEFFAPLTQAIDQLQAAHAVPNTDAAFYIVEQEEEPASPGKQAVIRQLDRDSVILRLIEQDADTDRLIWIDDKTLEILEAPATKATVVADEVASA